MVDIEEKKNNINWFPGHMRKALNETGERLKLVDIVYETADARIPFSSRNPELDKIIGNKPRIVILNKADLADPSKTSRWIESLEADNTRACALESTHKRGFDKLNQITMDLMKDKLEKAAEKGRNGRPIRVMVVGAPNTGKSTIINALAGRKAAVTGDKPGVTKDFKWIMTGGRLELMDMAGVLWPRITDAKSAICLTALGSVKEEITDVVKVKVCKAGRSCVLCLSGTTVEASKEIECREFLLQDSDLVFLLKRRKELLLDTYFLKLFR